MVALDSEQSMFSDDDDDVPLASQSSRNGITRNGHVATNGVGGDHKRVLDADGDTPMSDVDDDDVPLVSPLNPHHPQSLTLLSNDTSCLYLDSPKLRAPPMHSHPLSESVVPHPYLTRVMMTISPSHSPPRHQSTAGQQLRQRQACEKLRRSLPLPPVRMARSSKRRATRTTCR